MLAIRHQLDATDTSEQPPSTTLVDNRRIGCCNYTMDVAITQDSHDPAAALVTTVRCSRCGAQGAVVEVRCSRCGGRGATVEVRQSRCSKRAGGYQQKRWTTRENATVIQIPDFAVGKT